MHNGVMRTEDYGAGIIKPTQKPTDLEPGTG